MSHQRRVDAHAHVWRLSDPDYSWIPTGSVLARDVTPDDLALVLTEHDVASVVLVQAADSTGDTAGMLGGLRSLPRDSVVVGWADLSSLARFDQTYGHFREEQRLVGVRLLVEPTVAARIADSALDPMARALATEGLVLEVHTTSASLLGCVVTLACAAPSLTVVVDHLGSPDTVVGPRWDSWLGVMAALARCPNVIVKCSGLFTQCGGGHGEVEVWQRTVDAVVELFEPRRLMWGSDWPVCTTWGSYASMIAGWEQLLAGLSSAEADLVWSDNAAAVYRGAAGRQILSAVSPTTSATTYGEGDRHG